MIPAIMGGGVWRGAVVNHARFAYNAFSQLVRVPQSHEHSSPER